MLGICEARYRDEGVVVGLPSMFSSILRMSLILRGCSANMIPWRTGSDEDMHFYLNPWIAVDATECDAVDLAVMTATERRPAPATEAQAPSWCRFIANDIALAGSPGKRARLDFRIGRASPTERLATA